MFGSQSVKPIKAYDPAIVKRLNAVLTDAEKESLESWTLFADCEHIQVLNSIRDKVLPIQPIHRTPYTVYRGFRKDLAFQDTMKILVQRPFGAKLIEGLVPGGTFTYENIRPLSFSLDRGIARGFGRVVVRGVFDPKVQKFLVLTPELCVVRYQYSNLKKYETQDEIILFPSSQPLTYELMSD